MDRIGIIDLGSNSVRLVIIDVKDNGAHHQIENLKESIRLRSGTDAEGFLTEEGINSACEMLSLFVRFCRARDVKKIIAVATAAVRRAPNRATLINRVAELTGVTIQVLSSEEEAYLGYIGLVNSVTEPSGLMADLGGGALKLVGFQDRLNKNTTTLDFGSVSLMEKYGLQDRPAPDNLHALEAFLAETFSRINWLPNFPKLIGVGGSFRSLARVYRHHVHYVPDVTHGITIPIDAVKDIYTMLSRMDLNERRQVPGLAPDRADLSVTGFGIIYHLLKATGGQELMVSASSLRDGIFYKHTYPRDPILFNVLTHHINNLIDYHNLDEDHLRRVSNLAVILFDQLAPLHKLGSHERRLLLIAGLLHELGAVISVENMEKHTLYAVLNSPLRGITQRERVSAAFLGASNDGLVDTNLQHYLTNGPITEEDIASIKKLAPLLQIAHSLDRSRTGVVTNLQATLTPEACEIKVFGTQKRELEIRDARRRAEMFKNTYGVELRIVQG